MNGDFSVYKLRQNLSKSVDGECDDAPSQHSRDLLGSTDSESDVVPTGAPLLRCDADSTPPLHHGTVSHNISEKTPFGTSPCQREWNNPLKADVARSTDSDFLSDELSPPAKHKVVAIDTSRNKHFGRKLLPVQSPEFDNVMDQVTAM